MHAPPPTSTPPTLVAGCWLRSEREDFVPVFRDSKLVYVATGIAMRRLVERRWIVERLRAAGVLRPGETDLRSEGLFRDEALYGRTRRHVFELRGFSSLADVQHRLEGSHPAHRSILVGPRWARNVRGLDYDGHGLLVRVKDSTGNLRCERLPLSRKRFDEWRARLGAPARGPYEASRAGFAEGAGPLVGFGGARLGHTQTHRR